MNSRKRKKKFKKDFSDKLKLGLYVQNCDKCRQDSIAHEIKHHFEYEYVQNKLLFKWDEKGEKMLISKKQLNHIIRLCNSMETVRDYDFELIDEIKIL